MVFNQAFHPRKDLVGFVWGALVICAITICLNTMNVNRRLLQFEYKKFIPVCKDMQYKNSLNI